MERKRERLRKKKKEDPAVESVADEGGCRERERKKKDPAVGSMTDEDE